MESDERNRLISAAMNAREHSYSPYSNFRVGAALMTDRGVIFTGCNVENCAYGEAICAERTAIVKAVSEGYRKFKAIAITSDMKEGYIVPCGACRQVLSEFAYSNDFEVVCCSNVSSASKVYTLQELLPDAFTPASLIKKVVYANQS